MDIITRFSLILCLWVSLTTVNTHASTAKAIGTDTDSVITSNHRAVCEYGGKVFYDGGIIRHSNCVVSRCIRGRIVEIRGDCVDSQGRCHSNGTAWRYGCVVYQCRVTRAKQPNGSVTTKYEPVKLWVGAGCNQGA